uniref:ADP,ATP carrier protein n=1 Tax=Oryza rufipogon TaxID=4529 RepID=A0A0E0RCU6_ORYRU
MTTTTTTRHRLRDAAVASVVAVLPHEISPLISAASTFFFILSAYFAVLPLRDEGAISLGLSSLPGLFAGSLLLTLVAAPVASLAFSLPSIPKPRALVFIHRFFSLSLLVFFVLWFASTPGHSPSISQVSLLNLIAISSTWARVIDIMDSESGSRLFGFIGAGATLGQLFGSLFAATMAWLGPFLLLFSSLLMELAALSSKGICTDDTHGSMELSSTIAEQSQNTEADDEMSSLVTSQGLPSQVSESQKTKPEIFVMFEGFWLIARSPYLMYISLFLWLSAVVSSFFYFQKVTIVATTISSPTARRRTFALINSFIAVFILAGQLTLTGRILTIAGVTVAICASPFIATLNMVALALWPTWVAVAVTETIRKVTTYVLTRPGRELLFTVVSQDEKYKAKVCIDVVVQRLGDATAAGIYTLLRVASNGISFGPAPDKPCQGSAGQPNPPVLSRVPASWSTLSSAMSP